MKSSYPWHYQVIDEQGEHPDMGTYRTYGIQIGTPEPIHDISTDRTAVEKMAALFTEHQLSPIHFRDAVEDMLP